MFGGGGLQFSSQQPKTTTTGFTFGTPSSVTTTPILPSLTTSVATGTMFGSSFTTSISSSGPSMLGGTNTTLVTSTPSTGIFSGMQPKSTATQPGFNFGFGTSISTTPATGLGFGGLGGTPATSITPANTTAYGLGGVDFSQTSAGLSGGNITSGPSDSKTAVKETVLPNEISNCLETFKKYVKDQKVIREEITRVSSKPILKVQEETTALKQMLSIESNGLQRNAVAVEKLKQETAQEIKNAEIAQRTKDTPPTLQYENTAPVEYFQRLVTKFERQMQSYRQQIEQLEKHLTSMSQPSVLTPQELTAIMKRLHEAFIALAAHLQIIHEAVQHQKEQYLCYKKLVDGDHRNIFESARSSRELGSQVYTKIPVTVGPAPFSNTPSQAAIAMATALNRPQQFSGGASLGSAASQGTGTFGGGSLGTGIGTGPFGTQSNIFSSPLNLGNSSVFKPLGSFNTGSMFGSSGFGTSVFGSQSGDLIPQTPYPIANQNKPFQLQKPPTGNKRGKRWTST